MFPCQVPSQPIPRVDLTRKCVPLSQSTTRVKPFICTMPMRLDDGWNQIQFNLSDFTRRAYGGLAFSRLFSCLGPSLSGLHKILHGPWPFLFSCHAISLRLQAPITSRRYESRCMQTAESAGSTSPTGCTQKRSCPQSSSFSCPS